MTNRMLAALGGALVFAATAFAQVSPETPAGLAPPLEVAGPALVPPPDMPALPIGSLPTGQFWMMGEYALFWFSGAELPPLVTTSPAGTPRAAAGIVPSATTTVLFGDDKVNNEVRSGLRIGGGFFFDPERTLGAEVGGTIVSSQATLFQTSSLSHAILARPFFNPLTNRQDAVLIAFPGSSTGSVDVRASSGNFYEAHLDVSEAFLNTPWLRLESILGYRFYRYDEGLTVQQSLFPTSPQVIPGTEITARDSFATSNQFHGGDMGLRAQLAWQGLSLNVLGKVAIGGIQNRVKINGSQTTTSPGTAPVQAGAGVFALRSNIGTFTNHDWAALPELGATLGWQVTPNLKLRLGWTMLYLNNVARAAQQIDFTINPDLFPSSGSTATSPSRPTFLLHRDDLWINSLNMGAEINF